MVRRNLPPKFQVEAEPESCSPLEDHYYSVMHFQVPTSEAAGSLSFLRTVFFYHCLPSVVCNPSG